MLLNPGPRGVHRESARDAKRGRSWHIFGPDEIAMADKGAKPRIKWSTADDELIRAKLKMKMSADDIYKKFFSGLDSKQAKDHINYLRGRTNKAKPRGGYSDEYESGGKGKSLFFVNFRHLF